MKYLAKEPKNVNEYGSLRLKNLHPDEIRFLHTLDESNKIKLEKINSNKWKLTARCFVGAIWLKNNQININSKIGAINLFKMMRIAEYLPEIFFKEIFLSRSKSIQELIIDYLLFLVQQLFFGGSYRSYREKILLSQTIKGKILFRQTLRHSLGRQDQLVCSHDEYSMDILENHLLKYTLWQILKINPTSNQRLLTLKYLDILHDVTLLHSLNLLVFKSVQYHRLNEHYRHVHQLCQLLLQNFSFYHSTGEIPFSSFLINMPELFEKFIVNLLKYQLKEVKIVYHNRFSVSIRRVLGKISPKKVNFEPDFIIYKKGLPILVGDTKYTKSPFSSRDNRKIIRSNNFYQIHTYSIMKNCVGLLIYPQDSERVLLEIQSPFSKISITTIDLTGNDEDFKKNCVQFCNLVYNIYNSSP